jgi:hypothetical protein
MNARQNLKIKYLQARLLQLEDLRYGIHNMRARLDAHRTVKVSRIVRYNFIK